MAFQWAGSLNTPAVTAPIPPGHPLVAPNSPTATASRCWRNCRTRPRWFEEIPRAWLAVPLNHFGNLIGFVVLTRSRAPFKLDREVFELLRVVGREVASRVAEQRAAQILSQTRELRDYSQRFAFVLHDIKNVSGQLSMLLANAEVHADNPEFQRDMLATVRASVGKITRLLTRLQADRQERSHALIDPVERLKDIVATSHAAMAGAGRRSAASPCGDRPRRSMPVTICRPGGVAIDAEAFDAVAAHLLNNAIEASPPDSRVRVEVRQEALSVLIDIIDDGPGMTPGIHSRRAVPAVRHHQGAMATASAPIRRGNCCVRRAAIFSC